MIYRLNTVPRMDASTVVIHVNQYDYGGVWEFQIVDGDKEFTANGFVYDPTVTLNIYKPDNTVYSGAVSGGIRPGGIITVEIEEQMTAAAGKAIAELVISSGVVRKATANFIIDVERSPLAMDGVESQSLIDYVESNREEAQNATGAAREATTAAENASSAAEQAAQDAIDAVAHIEAMPEELEELAVLLTSPADAAKWLGFSSDQDAIAIDSGFVTPQMYGAVAGGVVDCTQAFRDTLASAQKIVIPAGIYKLTAPIWTDDSIVVSNRGVYPQEPLIVSKNIRETAPIERFISQFNATPSNVRDYRIQGGCYDSVNNRIILAYCTSYNSVTDDTDLVLTAYRMALNGTDFEPLPDQSFVIEGGGHGNCICYNPDNQRIYAIAGNGNINHQIAEIDASDPDTLTFIDWHAPITDGSRPWQMAYDEEYKIFYIESNSGFGPVFKAYKLERAAVSEGTPPLPGGNSLPEYEEYDFVEIDDAPVIPFNQGGVKNIVGLDYSTDSVISNGTIVIDHQLLQVHKSSRQGGTKVANNGVYLTQYNYASIAIKKIYRMTTPYPAGEETQTIVNVSGKFYMFTDIGADGKHEISISQLVWDDRVAGESESPYTDARVLATSGWHPDLNDLRSVGRYYIGSARTEETIGHSPTRAAYDLYVLPLFSKNNRLQVIVTSAADIYVRAYMAGSQVWRDWKQVTVTVQ